MPLFLAKTGSPPTVLTKDKDRIVGYTLTLDGAKQLRAAGVRSGGKIPARVFASLIRSGNAYSPRPSESAGQHRLDFADDNTADYLPRCEMTGTTGDVHLVVYGEGNGTVAKLLGSEPRFLLQKVTSLSVPVMILNPTLLVQLEAANKIPPKSGIDPARLVPPGLGECVGETAAGTCPQTGDAAPRRRRRRFAAG